MALALAVTLLLVAAPPDTPSPTTEVDELRRLMAAAPSHGGIMYGLARALARAGQAEEAVRWLAGAVDQGLDLDLADPAFKPLASRLDFIELQRKADLQTPISTSRVAFHLAEKELVPEGIAWDAASGDFFVGSLYKRKILRVGADGREADFVASGQEGLQDVLGLKVDAGRGLLWACTVASGRAGPEAGRSGVFKYDLKTARLLKAYWLGNEDGRHLLNDLVVAGDGSVYVTDSEAGLVHSIAAGADRLATFVGAGQLVYPNGLALSGDGARLYVADFKNGVSIVDTATKAVRPLPHPPDVSLAGIDGLCLHAGVLIAVQNGAGRERVVSYPLSADGERALGQKVLESRNPILRNPTTGVVADADFVYLASTNLDALDEDGNLKKDARLGDVVVLRAPLPRPPGPEPGAGRDSIKSPPRP